ncbi:hypothetical protein BAPKO_3027 (plasmid) [Borreliella afzelii PKo]|nr:hypothetical protein BAPKO_3027 [Borreliella afzelii PKo]
MYSLYIYINLIKFSTIFAELEEAFFKNFL